MKGTDFRRIPLQGPMMSLDFGDSSKELNQEVQQELRELIGVVMRDVMNRQEGNVAPDTYGADKFFLDGFLNDDMDFDFMTIAHEFLQRHFDRLIESVAK